MQMCPGLYVWQLHTEGVMRYVVRTYSVVPSSGVHDSNRPDAEAWFDDPAEAAELYMQLIAADDTAPMHSGHRLLTGMLRGDRSFAVLSRHSYYKIEALP